MDIPTPGSGISGHLRKRLGDLASGLRRPHHDLDQRRKMQRAGKRAGWNRRRMGPRR